MLTQERLKELLHYNSLTGEFHWKVTRGKATKGKLAGHHCYKNTKLYTIIGVDGSLHRAHRLAWLYITGDWPTEEIDHVDGDGTNNAWHNLRQVNRQENCRNMRLHSHNTSGVSGVSWRSQRSKWRAFIFVDNHQIGLGHFDDKFEAICARKSAENVHGFHHNHGSNRPL